MATIRKIILVVSAILIAIVSSKLYTIFRDTDLPDIPDGYWGPLTSKGGKIEDSNINPFKINVSEGILNELNLRLGQELKSKRYVKPLEGIGFEYGFNSNYLQKVLEYWHTKYDWRARETILNKYPQFKTNIAGLDIHFQHIKVQGSKYKETKPLLVIHGWPGSFVEMQDIIPLLTTPNDSEFNFDLVIPSLPGYGFSDAPIRRGMGSIEVARLFLILMQRLGYDKFYIQGGDYGAMIASHMATRYPSNVLATHQNFCMTFHPRHVLRMLISSIFPSYFMTPEEIKRIPSFTEYLKITLRETGYAHIQATKPDTIGVGLSNSPSGLAAYILEKYATWTNISSYHSQDGLIPSSAFTLDGLLDNVMVYWVTNSITTTMRYYSEFFSATELAVRMDSVPTKVPVGCLHSQDLFLTQSKWIMEDKFPNIIHYKIVPKGGHFIAMEQPHILVEDIMTFFKVLQKQF